MKSSLSYKIHNCKYYFSVSGWLYDIYGNWTPSFILTGCSFILAGVIIMLEPIIIRVSNARRGNTISTVNDNQEENQDQDASL